MIAAIPGNTIPSVLTPKAMLTRSERYTLLRRIIFSGPLWMRVNNYSEAFPGSLPTSTRKALSAALSFVNYTRNWAFLFAVSTGMRITSCPHWRVAMSP